jgi:hypothetical protein
MNTPVFRIEEKQQDIFSMIQTDLNPDEMTLPPPVKKKKKAV